MSDKLLKRYIFTQVTDRAPKLTKAIKISILEGLVTYKKAASLAKEDYINNRGIEETTQYEKALTRVTAYERAILAMGYTVEEREAGEQHDKQKN